MVPRTAPREQSSYTDAPGAVRGSASTWGRAGLDLREKCCEQRRDTLAMQRFSVQGWTASPCPFARPELRGDPSQESGFGQETFPPPSPGILLVWVYFAAVSSGVFTLPAQLLRGTAAAPWGSSCGSRPHPCLLRGRFPPVTPAGWDCV